MALHSDEALRRALRTWRLVPFRRQPSFGTKNLVRVARGLTGEAVFLKCAPNRFDRGVSIEARALKALAPLVGGAVGLPEVVGFEPRGRVLALRYLARAKTLHEGVSAAALEQLGRSVAALHRVTAALPETFEWAAAPEETLIDCFIWTRPAFATRLSIDGMRLIGAVQADARAMAGLIELARAPGSCLIHGDLKLPNVLVPRSGGPVLIDWELARWGDPAQDVGSLEGDLERRHLAPDHPGEALSRSAFVAARAAWRRGYGSSGAHGFARRVKLWSAAQLLIYAHMLVLADGVLTASSHRLLMRAKSVLRG